MRDVMPAGRASYGRIVPLTSATMTTVDVKSTLMLAHVKLEVSSHLQRGEDVHVAVL